MLSPVLTIFLIAGICMLTALVMRKRLGTTSFAVLFLLFLLPTTINETKITFFLLPLCLIMTAMLAAPRGKRFKMLGTSLTLVLVAGAIFIPIFDYLGRQNVGTNDTNSIFDMFTKKDYLEKYLNRETQVGSTEEVGRVDAFTVPLSYITKDPVSAAFGVGLGNASLSSLGNQFSGQYAATLSRYATGGNSAGAMLLELGLLGFALVYLLHWLAARDSLALARAASETDLLATLAIAWPAVVLMFSLTFFYTAPVFSTALSYLFWYFSGLFAARRLQLAADARRTVQKRDYPVGWRAATSNRRPN
jgi:hypothetical protein